MDVFFFLSIFKPNLRDQCSPRHKWQPYWRNFPWPVCASVLHACPHCAFAPIGWEFGWDEVSEMVRQLCHGTCENNIWNFANIHKKFPSPGHACIINMSSCPSHTITPLISIIFFPFKFWTKKFQMLVERSGQLQEFMHDYVSWSWICWDLKTRVSVTEISLRISPKKDLHLPLLICEILNVV
jgi:hypothetical protein